jgi:hypothetical protein
MAPKVAQGCLQERGSDDSVSNKQDLSHSTMSIVEFRASHFKPDYYRRSSKRNVWFYLVLAAYHETISHTSSMEIRWQPRDAGASHSPEY